MSTSYSADNSRAEIAFDFLSELVALGSPYYGYCLDLPVDHHPHLFSIGVFGKTSEDSAYAIAWRRASHADIGGNGLEQGIFSHVFSVNVLSPA